MNRSAVSQEAKAASFLLPAQGILQRKCACGNHTAVDGECAKCASKKRGLQRKLSIGASNDPFELEADRVANQVIGMSVHSKVGSAPLRIQRYSGQASGEGSSAPASVERVLASQGRPLESTLRQDMEQRFGHDFSQVRVHSDTSAEQSARDVYAKAYTAGNNIVFAAGQFAPKTQKGRQLIAHELTHVVQQSGSEGTHASQSNNALPFVKQLQRTMGDGHDLTSQRFSRLLDLEEVYDDDAVLYYRGSGPGHGSSGRGVQAIQHALYDLGYSLPRFGADGLFGQRTRAAVKAFQRDNPPLNDDGEVGPLTMEVLDARFGGAPALPAPALLSATWTPACVRSVLCPWSPHTIDVLSTRVTALHVCGSISWADETWNGTSWDSTPTTGGTGQLSGSEIHVLSGSCERVSETIYHEVLHVEQPSTHRTVREVEGYAYRIGEEFSIAMGLTGVPSFRSTDPQGREFADPTKIAAHVATYPGVPTGATRERIIGKASTHGYVEVERPNGSIYTRQANVDEMVDGPISCNPQVTNSTTGWACP